MGNTSQKRAIENYRKRLQKRGMSRFEVLRSPLDMIIAAVAEANHCLIVTENERDFAGLKVVNPLHAI